MGQTNVYVNVMIGLFGHLESGCLAPAKSCLWHRAAAPLILVGPQWRAGEELKDDPECPVKTENRKEDCQSCSCLKEWRGRVGINLNQGYRTLQCA